MNYLSEFLNIVNKYKKEAEILRDKCQKVHQDLFYELMYKTQTDSEFKNKFLTYNGILQKKNPGIIKKLVGDYFNVQHLDPNKCNFDEKTKLFYVYQAVIVVLNNNIKYYNYLINFFKKKNDVTLEVTLVLQLLQYAYVLENFPIEGVSQVLGLTFHKLSKVVDNKEIKTLTNYYNIDGTFKNIDLTLSDKEYANYLGDFKTNLLSLNQEITDYIILRNANISLNYEIMLEQVNKYFLYNIEEQLDNYYKVSLLPDKKEEKKELDPKAALNYVLLSYQDFYLINIPEDLSLFKEAVSIAPISGEEKEYILNNLEYILNDNYITYFKGENLRRYLKLLQVLNALNFNSDIYLKLAEARSSLITAINLQEEAIDEEDQKIIREEQENILKKWEKNIDLYFKELLPQSKLMLLMKDKDSSFIESDILSLGENALEETKEMLTSLTNESLLDKEYMEVKDFSLPCYVLTNNHYNLYIAQLALGIYEVIGLSSKQTKNKNMMKRIFLNRHIIENNAHQMFEIKRRNEVLYWEKNPFIKVLIK